MTDGIDIYVATINFCEFILGTSLILTLVRVLRGPTVADRVVALDLATTLIVGIIALDAIVTHQHLFLRIAVVITIVSFLGTVAFANFIAKGGES